MEKECKNCRFWELTEKKIGGKTFHNFDGECRHYPPSIVPYDEDHIESTIEFPATDRNDWCDKFESKK
jgi:hypothetical protein